MEKIELVTVKEALIHQIKRDHNFKESCAHCKVVLTLIKLINDKKE